jgi:hypothetical protein
MSWLIGYLQESVYLGGTDALIHNEFEDAHGGQPSDGILSDGGYRSGGCSE